jgi:hypothetical protein
MTSSLQIRPMTTNPGGVVDPDDLVGRGDELEQLRQSVLTGGAKLLGDRRLGKTSLLRLLELNLQAAGHTVIRVSAETDDPEVFGRNLIEAMRANHLLGREWSRWQREFEGELAINVGVAGLTLRGKASSTDGPTADFFRRCADAIEGAGPYRLVFIFDEITVLARALGPDGAVEFMRSLRRPRQEIGQVSMVLSGSIGLHHAVTDMSVVNDLVPVIVSPLANWEATYLARCLLRGKSMAGSNEAEIAQVITEQTCALPFYIHKLVEDLANSQLQSVTVQDVVTAVDRALRSRLWELEHYIERIETYYGADAELALKTLDIYALSADSLGVGEVGRQLGATLGNQPGRNELIELVNRLEDDHYLVRVDNGDRFATSLLRRAWREMRRLG